VTPRGDDAVDWDDASSVYRRPNRVLRGLFVSLVIGLVLLMTVPSIVTFLASAGSSPAVIVQNRTDETYIVWGSADPFPIPTGDTVEFDRVGFEITPHSSGSLPRDRHWEVVEVWTTACENVMDTSYVDQARYRMLIDPGPVVTITDIGSHDNPPVLSSTQACALQPWEPPSTP
jgi:hypothetical protein